MSTVEEIKAAIEGLPPVEKARLVEWISGWADDEWDRQMREDAAAGRLDHVLNRVRSDMRAGNVREMP